MGSWQCVLDVCAMGPAIANHQHHNKVTMRLILQDGNTVHLLCEPSQAIVARETSAHPAAAHTQHAEIVYARF